MGGPLGSQPDVGGGGRRSDTWPAPTVVRQPSYRLVWSLDRVVRNTNVFRMSSTPSASGQQAGWLQMPPRGMGGLTVTSSPAVGCPTRPCIWWFCEADVKTELVDVRGKSDRSWTTWRSRRMCTLRLREHCRNVWPHTRRVPFACLVAGKRRRMASETLTLLGDV